MEEQREVQFKAIRRVLGWVHCHYRMGRQELCNVQNRALQTNQATRIGVAAGQKPIQTTELELQIEEQPTLLWYKRFHVCRIPFDASDPSYFTNPVVIPKRPIPLHPQLPPYGVRQSFTEEATARAGQLTNVGPWQKIDNM
jgi:hypothetical protein